MVETRRSSSSSKRSLSPPSSSLQNNGKRAKVSFFFPYLIINSDFGGRPNPLESMLKHPRKIWGCLNFVCNLT